MNNSVQRESFNERAFWNEINPVLAEGTRQMLISSRRKEDLVAAYDEMDGAIGEIVERLSPPERLLEDLRCKLKDRVSLVGKVMKANGIDASGYWETDTVKVSLMLLKAIGATGKDIIHVDRLKQDAIEALAQGNFTKEGAERLLFELATYGSKDIRELLSNLDERPNHVELLRFLQKNGTGSAAKAAGNALAMLTPEAKPMKLAKVIEFPVAARQPMRHI
ncbi:MAG TPA: hypothetical protein VLD37_00465 [Candidatus Bilamarchaeum sp.]|nr:hypothetical protein [Candidatus Bilamarchaeum sp.]